MACIQLLMDNTKMKENWKSKAHTCKTKPEMVGVPERAILHSGVSLYTWNPLSYLHLLCGGDLWPLSFFLLLQANDPCLSKWYLALSTLPLVLWIYCFHTTDCNMQHLQEYIFNAVMLAFTFFSLLNVLLTLECNCSAPVFFSVWTRELPFLELRFITTSLFL